MGWTDSVPGLSALKDRATASLPRSTSAFSVQGIEGKEDGQIISGSREAPAGLGVGGSRKVDGRGRWWEDEDGTGLPSIVLRGLQTFFSFINLCIYIALAAFQSKWGVGVSFLVGLALFVNIEGLLHSGVFLSAILLADKFSFLRGLERALRQVRISIIVNAFQSLLFLLLAIITTVSANVGGCKDASKDSHAEVEGYTEALPGFCRNKRAGAAFFWLTFFAWLSSLALTLLTFHSIRRHPTSSGFVPPSSSFSHQGHPGAAFPADADEEAAFSRPSYEPGYAPAPTSSHDPFRNPPGDLSTTGGYRPSHDYAEGGERLFDEDGMGGQGYATYGRGGEEARRDPFEDPGETYGGDSGGAGGRYGASDDPYDAIRKSMEAGHVQRYD
ncbi:hypothetical protein JCM8547_007611 [Rhodosporidiobolus lusitaniae]